MADTYMTPTTAVSNYNAVMSGPRAENRIDPVGDGSNDTSIPNPYLAGKSIPSVFLMRGGPEKAFGAPRGRMMFSDSQNTRAEWRDNEQLLSVLPGQTNMHPDAFHERMDFAGFSAWESNFRPDREKGVAITRAGKVDPIQTRDEPIPAGAYVRIRPLDEHEAKTFMDNTGETTVDPGFEATDAADDTIQNDIWRVVSGRPGPALNAQHRYFLNEVFLHMGRMVAEGQNNDMTNIAVFARAMEKTSAARRKRTVGIATRFTDEFARTEIITHPFAT